MSDISEAQSSFLELDELSRKRSPIHNRHPLAKLFVTLLYLVCLLSFPRYQLSGMMVLVLYPVLAFQLADIPLRLCFYKLRVVLPLVCAVGIFNPIFDRATMLTLGSLRISYGMVSMLTLMLKGVFSLMASFLLIATTSMDALCAGLRRLHVPGLLVTLLLLTFRYISVMLEEVSVMWEAYHLRAPGQKGIHISAWGSFLGQLLLRSMDRAQELYESMQLRGFRGEFFYAEGSRFTAADAAYTFGWGAAFLLARLVDLPQLLGSLFV